MPVANFSDISNKISEKLATGKITIKQSQKIIKTIASTTPKNSSSTVVLVTNNSSKAKDIRLIDWFMSLFRF